MLGQMMAAPMVEIQLCEGGRCARRLKQGVNSAVSLNFVVFFVLSRQPTWHVALQPASIG
jgi:hypothetical protein